MSAEARKALQAGAPAVQVGALCLRADGRVLLITSRGTRRWIIPKGWTMPDRSPAAAALQEAWEEAGVEGAVDAAPFGSYCYEKRFKGGQVLPITVQVFRVAVSALAEEFREAGQRRRRWFAPADAAGRVAEPALQALLRALPPPEDGAGTGDRPDLPTP